MSQTSLQKSLTASVCNFLAAGAIVAGGSALSLWEPYLGLEGTDTGWLGALSANGIGAGVGAFLGGFLADRYGRRNVFTYNMLCYMLGTFLIMTATSFIQLLTGTIITGIAAGISVPASWTYICECSGQTHRARNIALSQMGWGLGPAVVLLLSYLMAPGGPLFDFVVDVADSFGIRANRTHEVNIFASRIVFGLLFIDAFFAWMFMRHLEPSNEWLNNKDKINKDKPLFSNLSIIFHDKHKGTLIGLTAMYLVWNLVAGAMGFFQGHIYETAGHLSNAMANLTLAEQWLLTAVITGLGAFYIDRFEHRKLLVGFVAIGAVAWLTVVFGLMNSYTGIMIITLLWAIQAGISVQFFFALWGVELFPFKYRAAAIGVMFCIVRVLSAVVSFGFSDLYASFGPDMIRYNSILMFALFALSGYIGWRIAPETRGKTMTEITEERYGK